MDYIFNDDRPIYIQLVEMLRFQIVSGKLKMGERIPSVRELALTAKVNPNTCLLYTSYVVESIVFPRENSKREI